MEGVTTFEREEWLIDLPFARAPRSAMVVVMMVLLRGVCQGQGLGWLQVIAAQRADILPLPFRLRGVKLFRVHRWVW